MSRSRPKFDERPASRGIFFANTDRRLKLRLGDISVVVLSIASIDASRHRGTIVPFEKGLGPTCSGYSVREAVDFTESQVFGCSEPLHSRVRASANPYQKAAGDTCSKGFDWNRSKT